MVTICQGGTAHSPDLANKARFFASSGSRLHLDWTRLSSYTGSESNIRKIFWSIRHHRHRLGRRLCARGAIRGGRPRLRRFPLISRDRGRLGFAWGGSAVLALAINSLAPTAGYAYTAAGDRNFPATLILPQVAPSDAIWVPISTQPFEAAKSEDKTRETNFAGTYSKLITERLGIQFEYGLTRIDRLRTSSVTGAQNFHVMFQYETILDPPHEFLLSVQVDHELGGTGDHSVGSFKSEALLLEFRQ